MVSGFKDLIAWRKAKLLAANIYLLTNNFPKEELYGITSQMRRSAISITSNLAEGYGRNSSGQFAHFISIAFGSACELENLLLLSVELEFCIDTDISSIMSQLEEVMKMLQKLRQNLREKAA